jgi:hypothetical protein
MGKAFQLWGENTEASDVFERIAAAEKQVGCLITT